MICHGFKGGIGTASRVTEDGYFVGVLVQANHGRPPRPDDTAGSIIVLVATDAPLLPHQCDRLAQRAALGIARTGGAGENSSGDLILAWSTGNALGGGPTHTVTLLAAETTTGREGRTAYGLDAALLAEVLERHRAVA